MKFRIILFWCCLMIPLIGISQESAMLSLRNCVHISLENNPTIITYQNLYQSARNDVKSSYSNILPKARIDYNLSRLRAGDASFVQEVQLIDTVNGQLVPIFVNLETIRQGFTRNNFRGGFVITQNIFDGGYWWNNIKQSKANRGAAEQDYTVQTNNIIKLVTQYYVDLLKQEKLFEVFELAVQRSRDNLERSDKMFEIGSIAKVDVFRARVNLGNDEISLINQRNAVQKARQTLNIVMGREPDTPLTIDKDFSFQYELESVDDLINEAFDNQPELKRQEMDIRAKELSVGLAKSNFWPTFSGWWSYNRDNTQFDKLYTDINLNWSISFGVQGSWNLFNGFADQMAVQNSKINYKNAMVNLNDYKRNVRAIVIRLFDIYTNLNEIIEINEENLEAAKEEYRLASERYNLGSGTSLDVREAQVNLTDAERILVAAEYDLLITYAELLEATGTIQEEFQLEK